MKKWTLMALTLVTIAASTPALSAQTVKVTESAPGLLKKAKITSDSAISIAKARLPKATISAAEIEQENGKLIYSFDLKTAGKSGIDEVNVDAMTGKLVGKVQHESPADEKKEAACDSVKAAAKAAKKPRA
jgi:DNA-directed RNA polymerase alpha subunit